MSDANSAQNFPGALIDKLHRQACKDRKAYYIDPVTGRKVLTQYYLLTRGYCCSSGCRHCPWQSKKLAQDLNNIGAQQESKGE